MGATSSELVARFNATCPPGTPMRYTGPGPSRAAAPITLTTKVKGPAFVAGKHQVPHVWVDRLSKPVPLATLVLLDEDGEDA